MTLRWFWSGRVRQTTDLCTHVRKLRDAQCDVLAKEALQPIDAALEKTEAALKANADDAALAASAVELEKTANKWLKPYPNAEWRENIEVFLVAIVVAMAIRTFFLQPFKIPTSSMQPSLFGVTVDPLYDPGFQMPGFLTRVYRLAVQGAVYHEIIAPQDGVVTSFGQTESFLGFFHKHTISVRYQDGTEAPVTTWFSPNPGDDQRPFQYRVGLTNHVSFHKGEPIIRFVETTGDHLFVDRLTYNFRHPERGEIIVFKTKGIEDPQMDQSQFYIKRLIALPGEVVSIGEDRHVRINGKRLDNRTPHFENLYSFDTNIAPRAVEHLTDQFYNGHILMQDPRVRLQTEKDTMTVPPKHYFCLGDNTKTSFDGRFWGYVPENNIIGRSFFIYWPIASLVPPPNQSRFGWGQR